MKHYSNQSLVQTGFMLLEALIAMLIFCLGILGLVALQALSVTNSSENKYRIKACYLADQLIGQMWASDRDPTSLKANFDSTGASPSLTSWKAQVNYELPLSIQEVLVTSPPKKNSTPVKITITWQVSDVSTHSMITHQYTVSHEITKL